MKGLQAVKDAHPRLFLIADRCLVFFVLFPSVVAFWAGVWMFLDLHFYPEHVEWSAWCCVAAGAVILVFFNVVQYELTERFLEPGWKVRNVVIKRLYTLVAACANVFLCRGFWMVQDYYSGVNVPSACFSLVFGTSLLICLRASCNGVASPLGTAFDEHRSFFIIQTRFRAPADKPLFLLLDSVFSVTVIGCLVIFEWRGIWVLLDLLLFPEDSTASLIICLVFGYAICIIIDILQDQAIALSAYLESKNHWFLRLAFEDAYLLIAKLGVIAVWRGIWIFCENYVADRNGPEQFLRVYINIVIGYVVPTLLLHGNSLFVLEVVLDGGMVEGAGCRVRVTMLENYLKLCARNFKAKKERALANGSSLPGLIIQRRSLRPDVESAQVLLHNTKAECHFENRSFAFSEFLPP
ncbi:hypothetical protein BV898_13161 [Hypsibius exemplaris]|uniref:Uncharacterized protein n=1 Tax=Hypsibius exemplaris TaxID=2072580 RepID=A0A1W0WBK2_HYPEX|nr:hypothetical protein BV898_13161 [Hypsibius exemplaris]